jgi:dTMP kinase
MMRSSEVISMDATATVDVDPALVPTNPLPFRDKDYDGTLIVGEGTSRGGKSTFLRSVAEQVADAVCIDWNSYPDFVRAVTTLKRRHELDALSHALVSIADYAMTFANVALPALREGRTVLSDRYLFTSWARDLPRGISPSLLAEVTAQFPRPDVVCFFSAPPEVTLDRYRERPEIYGHYATGSDIWPELTPEQAFVRYYRAQRAVYERLAPANDFVVHRHVDAVRAVLAART